MRRRAVMLGLAFTVMLAGTPAIRADADWQQKLEVSGEVLQSLENLREGKLPPDLVDDADCIAVIPHVVKGAFWVGGKHGRGLLSCRLNTDSGAPGWSSPVAIRISGLSVGAQFGGQVTDLVLFFMSRRGAESLLKNRITLGGDVSVAVGPVGRSAEAATDLRFKAEIYAYAKSRGLFAGIALEGGHLGIASKGNRRMYGAAVEPREVLFQGVEPSAVMDVQPFLEALPEAVER